MEGRYLVAILALALIFGGMYFKFLYDVPDGQEATNALVSWLLVFLGIIGIMASALLKAKNPFEMRNYENKNLNDKQAKADRADEDDKSERLSS